MKLALLALILAVAASPAFAAADWNGTWVGNWDNKGDGVQIIMAGNTAIGLFWHGDYIPDELHADMTGGGTTLRLSFPCTPCDTCWRWGRRRPRSRR